jgi:hypothetical protein
MICKTRVCWCLYIPYSGKFLYGANFHIFRVLRPLCPKKTKIFLHAWPLTYTSVNNVSIGSLPRLRNSDLPGLILIDMVACHHHFSWNMYVSFGTWRAIGRGLASVTTSTNVISCACMHACNLPLQAYEIKNMIIYSRTFWSIIRKLAPNKEYFPVYGTSLNQ